MTTARPDDEAIFHAARDIPDLARRREYVREACSGDETLIAHVEALLAVADSPDSLLDRPPEPVVTIDQSTTESPGTVIGPYKLLQQIGEGGMGTVFMAEQTHPIQRKVALKIIKSGMDSKQVIARFEAERQALAMMDHVNIARVFDGGATENGRPYFVMELVHGVPITKYCDDNHLTPRERLELFVPVCQAIQHAHQKGIIHRDIKPSNVMVTLYDGKPVPKVIDFGVAKATEQKLTERTLFTQYGTMVGTLEYMSPEQAEMSALGVDTRSDIYSLGVLLYELLTGSTPLTHKRMKEAAYAEILRMIKEEEPPKPSTRLSDSGEALASISANRHTEPAKLTKLVRGELDWIVMKTLEKDRNRRYETAKDFAADVRRYLDDEQVQACPPSVGYRFRKFARRNKAALAFTGLVVLILLTVTGGIGWNVRDRTARQTAVEQEVNLALKEAEQLQEQAKWPEALSAARRAEGLLAGSGSDELRDSVRQLRKDLEMVLRLEVIPLISSEMKESKWDYESADRAYAKAFADYGIDVAGLPTEEAAARIRVRTGVAVALVTALDDWAWARSQKDNAGGLALTALAQAADPDPWRRQVRQAVQQKDSKALAALAASPELLRQPTTSLLVLARALRARGNVEAQIEVLRQAQRQYPGDFWINFVLGETLRRREPPDRDEAVAFNRAALALRPQSNATLNNLGVALYHQKKFDEAIACYKKAIEIDPKHVKVHTNLGRALKEQGKPDEAGAWYRKAIELDPNYAHAHSELGWALVDQKKLDEAIACYRKAIEIDLNYAPAYNGLGVALYDQKKLDEAIAAYRTAIELDPKYANAHYNLGRALKDQGKLDEAIACYRKAIEIDPKNAYAHNGLGGALRQQKKLDEAIAEYREALGLKPDFAAAHIGLGLAFYDQKKLDEAMAWYKKAIDIDAKSADAHNNLGSVFYDQKKLDEAMAWYKKAIELDPKYAVAHTGLGNALREQKKLDEAIACYKTAIELDPKKASVHNSLGIALRRQGNVDEAIVSYKKAIELDPKNVNAHMNMGIALRGQNKLDEAIAWYKKAIDLDPDYALSHLSLGKALRPAGRVDEAIACYKTAIQLDPKNADAHYSLGIALQHQKKLDEAIVAYRKAIELDSKIVAYNNLGICLKQKGRLDEAIACYQTATELNPKDAAAYRNLGNAQEQQKKLNEAIASYKKAIELNPKDASVHNSLGIALHDQERLDEAIASYKKAIELDPKDAKAHNNLGISLRKQKKLVEAIACYKTAIELAPAFAFAYRNLGLALSDQKKPDEAIASFKKAIEIEPKYAGAYISLGIALRHQKKLDEAIASYKKAIEINPKDAEAHNYLGALLCDELKDHDQAIACFRKAIELDPKHTFARNNLGNALNQKAWRLANHPDVKIRNPGRAIELAKEAVDLAPLSVKAWQYLGWIHYRAGTWRASIEALEKSRELEKGGDAGQWIVMSLAHWKLANEMELPEQDRAQHKAEARRWYEQADKWIDDRWKVRPGHGVGKAIWDFRVEARKLMGVKEIKK